MDFAELVALFGRKDVPHDVLPPREVRMPRARASSATRAMSCISKLSEPGDSIRIRRVASDAPPTRASGGS